MRLSLTRSTSNLEMVSVKLFVVTIMCSTLIGAQGVKRKNHASVLILGAGAAGIMAAKHLQNNGVDDFIILEAEDRIGGRVKSVEFGGKTIELGANWVHGLDGNPLFDLAMKYKMAGIVSNPNDLNVRDYKGSVVMREAIEALGKFEKAGEFIHRFRSSKKKHPFDISARAALRYGGWPMRRTAVENAVDFSQVELETAAPAEMVSVLHEADSIHHYKEGNYFITDQRGYVHVIHELANEYLREDDERLRLNKHIATVTYTNRGVRVKTKSGQVYRGDYAICTFSIGVMQSDAVEFRPRIPQDKQLAYNSFGMGTYTKIFMKFDPSAKRFWDNNQYVLYADRVKNYYPIWQSLEADGLFPAGTNILLATVIGREADSVSKLPVETVKAQLTAVLRNMYGPHVPAPKEIIIPDWHVNPLYYGSFTHWPQGFTVEMHDLMSAPLKKLYFAGEGYSRMGFGYLHGALDSGKKTAEKIIADIRKTA